MIRDGGIMKLFERFYPDEYLDSAYEIDFEALYTKGYRGVIFDIDSSKCLRCIRICFTQENKQIRIIQVQRILITDKTILIFV